MARWIKKCEEFARVREMIFLEVKNVEIMKALAEICRKYANQKWLFADDFSNLCSEIDSAMEDADEDTVNYYLDEFYDLCDSSRVWLGL